MHYEIKLITICFQSEIIALLDYIQFLKHEFWFKITIIYNFGVLVY